MRYLTTSEVVYLNEVVVQQVNGTKGIVNSEALEEAIKRPQMAFDDYEPFPTLWEKTAALMENLIRYRPFTQANLATALVVMDVMLRLNGHQLNCTEADLEHIRSMGLMQTTIPQISEWIRSKSSELT